MFIFLLASCKIRQKNTKTNYSGLILDLYPDNTFWLYKKGASPGATMPANATFGTYTMLDSNLMLIPKSHLFDHYNIVVNSKKNQTGYINIYTKEKTLPCYLICKDSIYKIGQSKLIIDSQLSGKFIVGKSTFSMTTINFEDSTDYYIEVENMGIRSSLLNMPVHGVVEKDGIVILMKNQPYIFSKDSTINRINRYMTP